ncbi:MAG: histidine kinase [Betaproteobacteria bacterium HGW-Betaproteobacteria-22]|nr:MAG: histidine kinase [Betaproteobacteria bacterium HGW-Betaproteobacteria-22]
MSDELYVINAENMQILYVNERVLKNNAYDFEQLKQQSLLNVLGVGQASMQRYLSEHQSLGEFFEMVQELTLENTAHQAVKLLAKCIEFNHKPCILVIKPAVSGNGAKDTSAFLDNFLQALHESESRVDEIVSNTPGMFFQLQRNSEGALSFAYLSEGCQALLGLSASDLQQDAKLFYEMINPEDRARLNQRFELSAMELSQLDWEGRVWIHDWQDHKWINLRAIPHQLDNGQIQWAGIIINITESKEEKLELESSRRELAELTAHLNQVKEQERTRIAREIHDDLGGNLTAIKIGLSSIIRRITNGQPVTREQALNLEGIVDNTFEAVHRISSDLRPNVLDLGIVAALEWQAKAFEKQVGVPCHFTFNQNDIYVSPEQAIALFRICQESMSNIAKHAEATRVNLDLDIYKNEIMMMISDNGVGISASDIYKSNSFGLRGMQERVAALNGHFEIGQQDKGTLITVRLPLEQ